MSIARKLRKDGRGVSPKCPGALTCFYVDKKSGSTRMVEYVPGLDLRSEAGTLNLFDYLKKQ